MDAVLAKVLAQIRNDEARHVRISRRLARELGASDSIIAEQGILTREQFSAIVALYSDALSEFGIDAAHLSRRIRRNAA
jgi:rubrerythrin